ncbi:MAG: hypothetical protein PVI40_08075 [Chlamydiota bacterium]|jgi:hypothetical protein
MSTPTTVYRQILVNHCDITSYTDDIFPTFISYLSVQDQAMAQRVSSAWNKAFHSEKSVFARVKNIATCDQNTTVRLCKHGLGLPKITKKFHEMLDPQHMFLTLYVNRVLNGFISENYVNVNDFLKTLSEKVRDAIQDLNFLRFLRSGEYLNHWLPTVFALFPNIRTLTFGATLTGGNSLATISTDNKLKEFNLVNCKNIRSVALRVFFSKVKNLEVLSLASSSIQGFVFENFDSSYLQKLELRDCRSLEEEHIRDLLSKTKNLESLNLSHTYIIGGAFENFNSSHLEELILENCRHLEEERLRDLLSKTKNLELFYLSDSTIQGVAFEAFDPAHLKILRLDGCTRLESRYIRNLLSKSQRLEDLSLMDAPIQGNAFEGFDPAHLKILRLDGCTRLEEACVRNLLHRAKNLEMLNLAITSIEGTAFEAFDPLHLQTLILRECTDLDAKNINELLSKTKELKELDLTGVFFDGVSFEKFDASCLQELSLGELESIKHDHFLHCLNPINLKRFDAIDTQDIDEEILQIFLSKAKSIEFIDLSNTPITGKVFEGINLPNLRNLNVHSCENLNREYLRELPTTTRITF